MQRLRACVYGLRDNALALACVGARCSPHAAQSCSLPLSTARAALASVPTAWAIQRYEVSLIHGTPRLHLNVRTRWVILVTETWYFKMQPVSNRPIHKSTRALARLLFLFSSADRTKKTLTCWSPGAYSCAKGALHPLAMDTAVHYGKAGAPLPQYKRVLEY